MHKAKDKTLWGATELAAFLLLSRERNSKEKRERESVGIERKLGESQQSCHRSSRACGGGLSNFESETRVESSFRPADNYAIFIGIFKYFQFSTANNSKKY